MMNRARTLTVGIVAAVLVAASAWSNEVAGMDYRQYEYSGEKFEVSEPKDGRMLVSGRGLTATISVHDATGKYREEVRGWGGDHPTLQQALESACGRILARAAQPSDDALRKGLDEFYDDLK